MWMKIVQSSILNIWSNWNFPQLTPRQERHLTAARRSEPWILVALELVTTRRQGKKFPSEHWRLEVDSQVWEVMAKKFVAVLDLNCPVWTNSHRTFCFCIKGSICLQSMSQHFFFKPIFLIVFISCNIPVSWLNQSGSSCHLLEAVERTWRNGKIHRSHSCHSCARQTEDAGWFRMVGNIHDMGLKLSMKLNWIDCRFQTFAHFREITSS